MSRIAKFQDSDIYPVSSSESGRNAFYHRCEHVGHHPSFASCLSRIEQRKGGRLDTIYATCSAEIGKKTCPAIAMRKEELEAGKAIYFIDRKRLHEFCLGQHEQTVAQSLSSASITLSRVPVTVPATTVAAKPQHVTPVIRRSVETVEEGNIYAAAINAELKKVIPSVVAKVAPAPTHKPAPSVVPTAKISHQLPTNTGEKRMTMLEIARLRMSQKGA